MTKNKEELIIDDIKRNEVSEVYLFSPKYTPDDIVSMFSDILGDYETLIVYKYKDYTWNIAATIDSEDYHIKSARDYMYRKYGKEIRKQKIKIYNNVKNERFFCAFNYRHLYMA